MKLWREQCWAREIETSYSYNREVVEFVVQRIFQLNLGRTPCFFQMKVRGVEFVFNPAFQEDRIALGVDIEH